MSELKPCPFCGGEAEMLTAESMHGGYLFGIMCNDCRSRGDVYGTEAEAIAAWNTRAERTCKVVEKDGVMRCSICDYPLGIMSVHAYCAGCGAKVVGEEGVRLRDAEHGTLTAEQVREAIERHSAWVIGNNRCFHDGAYEEIADELRGMVVNE